MSGDSVSDNSQSDVAELATSAGEQIRSPRLAPLKDSTTLRHEPKALRAQLAHDGYLYLPRLLAEDDIVAARRQVFSALHEVDEIAAPPVDGIFTGRSRRDTSVADRGTFWRSVSESWALRRVTHGALLRDTMGTLFGEPAIAQDFLFLRPAGPGKNTPTHCDRPFFTRTTDSVLTAWIALGQVPLRLGPLYIVEGSHQFDDIKAHYQGFDVARHTHRKAALDQTPLQLATERNTRILSGNFAPGDVVIFNMFLLHGALDNISANNEVRLSVDVRYQPASAPRDPRYFGANPTGTTGAGYGELVGARPLTEAWHTR